jgi:alcohol dehydrogenase (cytochrome c)
MTDYVEQGAAVDLIDLTTVPSTAPPVTRTVNYERILGARSEPQNWLTYHGAYDGQRYSQLDQITTENVAQLTPAWVFQFGPFGMHSGTSTYAFEATPLVVDGTMFVSGFDGWFWALNAVTGQMLWQYKHASPFDTSLCCGNVNRGVAVAKGKVFAVTLNAHLIALDAETGEKMWDVTWGDVRAGESGTVAPLIVKDLVIVGSSGGEFGNRGHLDAFNIDTGEHVWRCYTVPKPGEPESDTWPANGEAWQRGGGNCWVTGTFDPDTNLLYWGTGNPGPDFDGDVRPGDNRWTDSVIAVDVDTGQIRWGYQCTPHDLWDYDSVMECILFEADGRKLLAHFDKNGYCFTLDRTNGELVRVTPFGERITWGEITPDGRVTAKIYPKNDGKEVHFWPGPAGAKEWTHAAYSPRTRMFYVPVQDVGARVTTVHREFKESIPYWGASVSVDTDDTCGFVKAFDADTGRETWRWRSELPMCASVLATAGDLVFTGDPAGIFYAFHARTGEVLWKFNTGSGHHGSPMSYSVDGRQYIAVPSGWGGWIEGFAPKMLGASRGDALFVFALPE